MQTAPDKYDVEQDDSDFDFLKSDPKSDHGQSGRSSQAQQKRAKANNVRNSRSSGAKKDDKPFPKIRKPVPVTESGANRAPKAGDPVAPPPPLTDGIRPVDGSHARRNLADREPLDLDKLDLGLDDVEWQGSHPWAESDSGSTAGIHREERKSPLRTLGYSLGFLLVLAGLGAALYSLPTVQQWLGSVSLIKATPTQTPAEGVVQGDVDLGVPKDPVTPAITATSSLYDQYQSELAVLQSMMENQEFEAASARLLAMDRTLYGYGGEEFRQIERSIAAGSDSAANPGVAQPSSDEQAAAAQAAAAQAAAAQEAADQAAALQAAEEAAALRAAEEEAAAAQAAAEQAAAKQAAAQRAAEEKAAAEQLRADRIAQQKARQAQLEIAIQQRLAEQRQQSSQQAAAAAAYQPAEPQTGSSDSELLPAQLQSTPSRTVQEIAAAQRQAARQQRLIDAQNRSQASAGTVQNVEVPAQDVLALADPSSDIFIVEPAIPQPQPITDADLQSVYGMFAQLVSAIEGRDIDAMINLTENSGLRIQQFLQLFENNVGVEARLRNVSTLDATGEIQGTLQVTRLERSDGSVTGPPLNLSSLRLSAVRDGNNWSAIRW